MKGIVQSNYEGISALSIQELPAPKLTPASLIVGVHYVPVLPFDIRQEEGSLRNIEPQRLPKVIGLSYTGIIKQAGNLRDADLIGKKVMGITLFGSAKEQVTALPFYSFILPEDLDLKDAATIFGGADTALMLVQQSKVKSGQRCLVIGASGGIGGYLVQLLQNLGAEVVIFSSERSKGFVRQHFQQTQVKTKSTAFSGGTFDYIFDTAGNAELLHRLERTLIKNGLLLSLVLPNFTLYRRDVRYSFKNKRLLPKDYRYLIAELAAGRLRAHIDLVYPYEQVKQAQYHVRDEAKRGRTLLSFKNDAN